MTTRRFPPPWTVEELDACFVVRNHSGQKLDMSISRTSRDGDRQRIYGAGRGETDCRKCFKTAEAIEPPSDVGSATTRPMRPLPLSHRFHYWSRRRIPPIPKNNGDEVRQCIPDSCALVCRFLSAFDSLNPIAARGQQATAGRAPHC